MLAIGAASSQSQNKKAHRSAFLLDYTLKNQKNQDINTVFAQKSATHQKKLEISAKTCIMILSQWRISRVCRLGFDAIPTYAVKWLVTLHGFCGYFYDFTIRHCIIDYFNLQ